MGAEWLAELNPAQRQAATHPVGPILVIAGAGTGKTKTLAARVAWLISQGVPPERILLLTFTRRASAEMLARAGRLTGQSTAGRVWGGTFHATANRLLRHYGRSLGLSPEFTVMDQGDAGDLMNLIRTELGLGMGKRRFPQKQTLAAIYSRSVNSRTKAVDVVKRHFPWCEDSLDGLRQIFQEYTQRKRRRQVLDYDDLLLFWNALLQVEGVGEQVAGRFDHILVDEYQDTNVIQAEILRGMRKHRSDVMVVGDDAQSIYSFRAANVRNILDFPLQFPNTEVVKLEQNYRSSQPILDASNAVMARAPERFTKNLFTAREGGEKPGLITCQDESHQCEVVCDHVLARREEGMRLQEQAVLFRAGHHSDMLEVELSRRNIPFVKYGGLKFVEAAHVKDLLALLRLMENPTDELAWHRILLLLEGIGPAAARRMVEALMGGASGEGSGEGEAGTASPLHRLLHSPPNVPASAAAEFQALREAVADCVGISLAPGEPRGVELSPAAQIERLRKFYEPVFQRTYENPTVRLRDLDQLEQIAGGYSDRGQFITDLTLDPPTSTQDLAGPPLLDEDYLILSTIHSAKGCEWDAVHLIHVSDGMIPSDMATGSVDETEEERRLLYVAMTRAKDSLQLYFPLRYYDGGGRRRTHSDRHSYAQLTRFIPDADMDLYERLGPRGAQQAAEAVEAPIPPTSAVDALLDDLWS